MLKHTDYWERISPLIDSLEELRLGQLPVEKAKEFCAQVGIQWFSGIPPENMQKIMWFLMVHTDAVKIFFDGYDKSGPAPLFMAKIDELLQTQLNLNNPGKNNTESNVKKEDSGDVKEQDSNVDNESNNDD